MYCLVRPREIDDDMDSFEDLEECKTKYISLEMHPSLIKLFGINLISDFNVKKITNRLILVI